MPTLPEARAEGGEHLLSTVELAVYLSISLTGVYRLIERRSIPFHRIARLIRFRQEDVDRYLVATRVGKVGP